ncbi:MAG: hypothetical protein ACJ762_18695 [Solirubrobacteraceae bacterium]
MRKLPVLLVALILGVLASVALGHQSGCHSNHSCPSDHHTYVWYDGSGQGWDCVKPGADEYDASQDTTVITSGGYTYYCRAAGAVVPPATTPSTPPTPTTPPATTTTTAPPPPPPTTTEQTPPPATTETSPADAGGESECEVDGALPDPFCTPGAIFKTATAKKVCKPGYSGSVRNVSTATKNDVYATYGITQHDRGTYEMDHLVPLELGGSNAVANLFPEAARPVPGFHEKDRLENKLHSLVCSGRLSVRAAQRAIARDWVAAYEKYLP